MGASYAFAITERTSTTTSLVCEMPEHASGDLLVAFANKDGNAAINDPGGIWTSRANQATVGSYGRILTAVASSSSETLTLTTATTDTWMVCVIAVRNPHATFFDFAAFTGSDDSTNPMAGLTGRSTANDNSIVFHFFSSDSGQGPICQTPAVNVCNGDAGANSLGVAYTFQKTAGSIPALDWFTGINDDSRCGIIAIRLADTTDLPPFADPAITSGEYLRPLHGTTSGTTVTFGDAWDTASPMSETSIGGVNLTFDAIGNTADNGINPYLASANITPAVSATNLGGNEFTFGAAIDMGAGILVGGFRSVSKRDLSIDVGGPTTQGLVIALRSGAGDVTGYSIAAKGAQDLDTAGYNTFAIGLNDGATEALVDGTLDTSAVTSIFFLGRPVAGTLSVSYSTLALVSLVGIAGGSVSKPVDFADIAAVMNNSIGVMDLFKRTGSAATVYAPMQFGGSDRCCVEVKLRTFEFPRAQDGANYYTWNAAANVAGVSFYGVDANDSFVFKSCVFTGYDYRWEFDASHSASTALDFGGCFVVGANVTLRSTVALDGVTFASCVSVVQNNADLDNCTIDGSMIDSDNPADISDCEFVYALVPDVNGDEMVGHGIRITTPGTYSFVGNTFTGYATIADQEFDTGTDVSSGGDTVTLTGHGFATGEFVNYTKLGGAVDMGLIEGGYYVRAVDANTLAFFATAAAAIADSGREDLTSTGSETHRISSNRVPVWNDSGGAVTLNVSGGGDANMVVRNSTGSTTTIASPVTTTVTVTAASTGTPISGARVLATASDGTGPMPFEKATTITRSGSTATATCTAHGLVTGTKAVIKGSDQPEYNGVKTVTVTGANTFTFTVSGTPTTPATGTIKTTGVILDGTTNGSGVIDDTRTHASNQPITVRVRKGTSAPYYKTGGTTGTVSSTAGVSLAVQLVSDE